MPTRANARQTSQRKEDQVFLDEQMAILLAVESALRHSACCCSIATQTDEDVTTSATFFNMSDGEDDLDEPAPTMNHQTVDAARDYVQTFTEDASLTSTTNTSSIHVLLRTSLLTLFLMLSRI